MLGTDRHLWAGMLAHLKSHHPGVCRQWFEELDPLGVDAGVLHVRATSAIHRDYLRARCAEPFNDAATVVSKHLLTVQFLGPEDPPPRRQPAPAPASVPHAAPQSAMIAVAPAATAPAPTPAPAAAPEAELKPSALPAPAPSAPAPAINGTHAPARNGVHAAPVPSVGPSARPAVTWDLTSKPARPDTESLVINPDYSFEHFVVGPGNRMAHAAALAVAGNPGRTYNPYFVHGGVGLGKTHLLQAICVRIKEANPDARIYYTSCEGFMTQFMDAVQAGEMGAFRHRFRDADVLVIDDIHFLAKRDRTQEEFFHTFNSLYQLHKQIVLSSDAPPEDIPDLEDRLVSRFKWGLVTSVATPCYETRVAILKNKARMRGFTLPDDVACHVAAKIESNIRELEGAVTKLQAVAALEGRPIDMTLCAVALGEEAPRGDRQVQIQAIMAAVTDFYGVKLIDLQSKRRQRSVAMPRQVCMYLARKHTRYSLEEIGGYFGGRDHTTVMHAVRKVEELAGADSEFGKVLSTLETQLRTAPV
jgi:chromosomal replication initiator protein